MQKRILKLIALSLLFTFVYLNLSAQKKVPEISFGILYADIKTLDQNWDRGNTWRRGIWVTLEESHKVYKWFNLDTGITYQERIPLEVLTFNWGLPSSLGTTGRFVFGNYPTNPQNEIFTTGNYLRIPNFKYLNIEIIPKIIIGNIFSFTFGAGIFGGLLLNKQATTVTKEDLPFAQELFGPPHYINGEVTYQRYDCGWIPKAAIAYKINDKIKVGLQFKSYHSFIRLNDTFVRKRALALNMRWVAHAGGLSLQYKF